MSQEGYFTATLGEDEYDPRLQLHYARGGRSTLLFDFWLFRLFGGDENELHVHLNFGSDLFLPHAVKQLGESLAFVPRFADSNPPALIDELSVFTWREYLHYISPQTFIFPRDQWDKIWFDIANKLWVASVLGLDLYGLQEFPPVTTEDVLTLWLISSGFEPETPAVNFLPEYAQVLADSIVAEDPECEASVRKTVLGLLSGELAIETAHCHDSDNAQTVTAYLLSKGGSTKPWRALSAGQDSCVLLNDFPVRVVEQATAMMDFLTDDHKKS